MRGGTWHTAYAWDDFRVTLLPDVSLNDRASLDRTFERVYKDDVMFRPKDIVRAWKTDDDQIPVFAVCLRTLRSDGTAIDRLINFNLHSASSLYHPQRALNEGRVGGNNHI